jgi:hypothetical protein
MFALMRFFSSPVRPNWFIRAALCVLGAVLLLSWAKFAYNSYLTLIFPDEVDPTEGIVWQQAVLIPGPRMYGDLHTYPYIAFEYPPLYHLIVHGLATLGAPWLAAGRAVAIASTFLLALPAAAIVHEAVRQARPTLSRPGVLIGALVTGLLIVTLQPIKFWADQMRVDMTAAALEMLGLYLAIRSFRQPNLAYGAVTAFVLAMFTRQTAVFGAAASLAVFAARDPRHAFRLCLTGVAIGGLAACVLMATTDGGFLRHIVFYNVNRFSLQRAYEVLAATRVLEANIVYLSIAVFTAASLVAAYRTRLREMPAGYAVIVLYFLLGISTLAALGKSGSNLNYLIPFSCSWALLAGIALAHSWHLMESHRRSLPLAALLAALIVQGLAIPGYGRARVVDPVIRRQYEEIVALIRSTPLPVLSENMVALMQAGKDVPWEPAMITELTVGGVFDESKLIDMIQGVKFAFVVVTTSLDDSSRYTPAVSAALMAAYPNQRRLGNALILTPVERL